MPQKKRRISEKKDLSEPKTFLKFMRNKQYDFWDHVLTGYNNNYECEPASRAFLIEELVTKRNALGASFGAVFCAISYIDICFSRNMDDIKGSILYKAFNPFSPKSEYTRAAIAVAMSLGDVMDSDYEQCLKIVEFTFGVKIGLKALSTMQIEMFTFLDHRLDIPTVFDFIQDSMDWDLENNAHLVCRNEAIYCGLAAMLNEKAYKHYYPSEIAEACVAIAFRRTDKNTWKYTSYMSDRCISCANRIDESIEQEDMIPECVHNYHKTDQSVLISEATKSEWSLVPMIISPTKGNGRTHEGRKAMMSRFNEKKRKTDHAETAPYCLNLKKGTRLIRSVNRDQNNVIVVK